MRIPVVCAGNSCRSPAGEAAIRAEAATLDEIISAAEAVVASLSD